MKNYLILLIIMLLPCIGATQIETKPDKSLVGYWAGAIVRSGNSVQNMRAEIYEQGDSLVIGVSIPDWAYYPPRKSSFDLGEGNLVHFDTYYGKAIMLIDSTYLEMTGTINKAIPPYQFHLKKSLKPFSYEVLKKEITIENNGANVSGTLYYRADLGQSMTTAILVHGRGCGTRKRKQNRAKKLAEYGLAAFVYDKRGSEPSGYPCEKATHNQNVSDINAIVNQLAKESIVDRNKIGLISYSAGAWIAAHVTQESQTPMAFLITLVGPTTSVKQQQLDGLEAFMKEAGFDPEAIDEAKTYTMLMFAEDDYQESYEKMQKLLVGAKEKGWDDWLVEDDYASSPEAIKEMWVQRFAYDPAEALMGFEKPYLAVFAEKDPAVPYAKQIAHLQRLKEQSPQMNVSTKIIPSAYHNLEHGPKVREMGRDPINNQPAFYFKYDRVAYGAIAYIVEFLKENNLIQK